MITFLLEALKQLGVVGKQDNDVLKAVDLALSYILDPAQREAEAGLVIEQLKAGEIPTLVRHIFGGKK
jgi:hypothetical protein